MKVKSLFCKRKKNPKYNKNITLIYIISIANGSGSLGTQFYVEKGERDKFLAVPLNLLAGSQFISIRRLCELRSLFRMGDEIEKKAT